MIVRVIAVDPRPRLPTKNGMVDDVVVYQVPEHSRAHELLVEMLDECKVEHARLDSEPKPKKEKPPKQTKCERKRKG